MKEDIEHSGKLSYVAIQSPTPWTCYVLNIIFWIAISIVFFVIFCIFAMSVTAVATNYDDDDDEVYSKKALEGILGCFATIFFLLSGFSLYHLYKGCSNRRLMIYQAAADQKMVIINSQTAPSGVQMVQSTTNPTISANGNSQV